MCHLKKSTLPLGGRRIIKAAMIIGVCFALWACGAQSDSQYNVNTNQRISFQEISFQVPEEWEKVESKEFRGNSVGFAEWNNGDLPENYMNVIFFETETMRQRAGDIKRDPYTSIIEQKDIWISELPAQKITVKKQIENQPMRFEVILFQLKDGVIELTFYSKSDEGYRDFAEVIDSIERR